MEPARDAVVVLGEVVGAYGVRGWVKVRPFTQSPQTLLEYAPNSSATCDYLGVVDRLLDARTTDQQALRVAGGQG